MNYVRRETGDVRRMNYVRRETGDVRRESGGALSSERTMTSGRRESRVVRPTTLGGRSDPYALASHVSRFTSHASSLTSHEASQ